MIRLGIIGTGGMANGHAQSFKAIRGVQVTSCCDIVPGKAQAFAERHGIKKAYTDYAEMLDVEKLDAVTCVTADLQHAEVSLAVIAKGLHILCEKPLASTLADAKRMADAAQRAGVINMVNFSYRNSCGLQKAAEQVRAGKIGRVIHVESSYLQSWLVNRAWGDWRENTALTWRLSTKHGSLGTLGDIGCHILDMTTFLCGQPIAELTCNLATFDKGIPGNAIGEYVFDANDSFAATVRFANGALGTVHSSRWASGHANSLRVRVYGDKGAVEVDLDRDWNSYRLCAGKDVEKFVWKDVPCKPTPTNYQRFITSIKTGKPDVNDFANGACIQAYLDGCIASDKARGPVSVA